MEEESSELLFPYLDDMHINVTVHCFFRNYIMNVLHYSDHAGYVVYELLSRNRFIFEIYEFLNNMPNADICDILTTQRRVNEFLNNNDISKPDNITDEILILFKLQVLHNG